MREGTSFWQRGTPTFRDERGSGRNSTHDYRDGERPFPPPESRSETSYGSQNFEKRDGRGKNFENRERRGQNFDTNEGRGQNFNNREGRGQSFDRREGRGQNFENREGRGQNFENREGRGQNFENREGRGQNFDNREGRGQNFDNREGRGQNFDNREGRGQNFDNREGRGQNFDNRDERFERGMGSQQNEGNRSMRSSLLNENDQRPMRGGEGMGLPNSHSSRLGPPVNSGGIGQPAPIGINGPMDSPGGNFNGPMGSPGGNFNGPMVAQAGGFNGPMGPSQGSGFNSPMGPSQGGFNGPIGPSSASGPFNMPMGPGGFNNMGPSPSGGFNGPAGPNSGMGIPGGMGMPRTGGGNQMPHQNFGGGIPSEVDLVSSIQTLQQMTNQSEIASKIISAVLSSVPNIVQGNPMNNPMGNPMNNNFQGGPMGPGPMGGNNFNNGPGPNFRGNAMNNFEDRRPFPPRHSSPPSSRHFRGSSHDRFRDDKNKRSSLPSSRGKFDRQADIKKRLDYKSSKRGRDDKVSPGPLNSKKLRLSAEKAADKKKDVYSKESAVKSKRSDVQADNENTEEKTADGLKEKTVIDEPKKKPKEMPPAALFCHICNQGKFTSEQTYLYHLEGVRHKKTANSFWDKSDATLEYLRKNAKLASIRFGGFDNSFAPSTCNVCYATVKESFKNHKRLLEHKIVSRFLMPRCCGKRFKSRHDMDEHRLSLPHLRRIYEKNEEKKSLEEDTNQSASYKEAMDELNKKITSELEEIDLINLPPFDGNAMIGINFLELKESVLCKPCQLFLPVGSKTIEAHLVSLDHYDALKEYLINKGKEEKPVVSKEKTAGDDETANSSVNSNTKLKRERDEKESDDEEESDDDMLVRHIANSDVEEEDDLPFIDENSHIVLEEVDDAGDKDTGDKDKTTENDDDDEAKDSAEVIHVED